ncbi:MAG: glycosyltransferase family 2 protein [Elusimicrobiota bacterium]
MAKLSVIIPAHNAENDIRACLEAVFSQAVRGLEVIVVDDGSRDRTPQIAQEFSCATVALGACSGAAAARNAGAQRAAGELLLFLDADTTLQAGGLEAVLRAFAEHPEADAVQGVYALETDSAGSASLARHYYKCHKTQRMRDGYIAGLNSYCFAVRREAFEIAGGFDPRAEGVEDVELGMRLAAMGRRIVLDKKIQVRHRKHYTLWSLLRTDFRKVRAKAGLLLDRRFGRREDAAAPMTFSLNTKGSMVPEFLSVILSALILADAALLAVYREALFAGLGLGMIVLFALLNIGFVNVVRRNHGASAAARCLVVCYFEMLAAQLAVLAAAGGYLVPAAERRA